MQLSAPRFISLAAGIAMLASPVFAAPADRLLTIVPVDAASVGMVRVDALRAGTLTSRLFAETDKLSMDGEAYELLKETGLKLTEDIDAVVFAMSPSAAGTQKPEMLVAASGRFDVARLGGAVARRGGIRKQVGNITYYLMPESSGDSPAVCFYDKNLVLAGSESSVVEAIQTVKSGGSKFLAASGIGLELGRIDRDADCWMLMDVQRSIRLQNRPDAPKNSHLPSDTVNAAMKRVSTLAVWASDSDEALTFGATAVSSDQETRELLADMLRGLTASWRMAAQEKHPELVSVIRGFDINTGSDSVWIKGSVPAAFLKNFAKRVEQQAAK